MSAAASGRWDCHAHVFGPYDRYPLAEGRNYTPPEAPRAAYDALLAQLDCTHAVLVHPSAYGTDYRLVLDTLAERPLWRGVLVAQPDTTIDLKALRAQGVRALRYSHRGGVAPNFAGSASLQDLVAMGPALADAGLHAELWTDRQVLPEIADTLRALPVPVVVDHMAGFDAAAGVDEPGFDALVRLVGEGRVWAKLCPYRNLLTLPAERWAEASRPFHQALLRANPSQLVWGSDWPHLNVREAPDTGSLLQLLRDCVQDEAALQGILERNPRSLYA